MGGARLDGAPHLEPEPDRSAASLGYSDVRVAEIDFTATDPLAWQATIKPTLPTDAVDHEALPFASISQRPT